MSIIVYNLEVKININGLEIDYLDKGKGEVLVWLHGWAKGIGKEKYQELIDNLARDFRVIAIDLPGFGNSDEPKKPWGVVDYTNLVKEFLDNINIEKYVLAGHSFGGRLAIVLAASEKQKIEKLILVDSAGIERKNLIMKLWLSLLSLVPKKIKIILRGDIGSKDYREASGVMKQSIKLVVGENLEKIIGKITVSTLIVWGSEDKTTPLWQGQLINKLINGSKLTVVEGANHGLPYRNPVELGLEIRKFLC